MSTNYAQRCYSHAVGAEGCSSFVRSQLPTAQSTNATCPFGGNICHHPERTIKLDTGYLDTHFDLGLNTPPEMRMKLRIINHCAPLVTEGYKETFKFSDDKVYSRYMYGGTKSDNTDETASVNYTYEYEQRSKSQLRFENFTSAPSEYALGLSVAYSFNKSFYNMASSFFPIDELFDVDGDTVIFFLSANDIFFLKEVDDPWFSAHESSDQSMASNFGTGREHFFLSDEAAAPLGCRIRYQVCDAQAPPAQNCSRWGGLYDLLHKNVPHENKLGEVLSLVAKSLYTIDDIVDVLKSSSLLAKYSTEDNYQLAALPDNQWELEVANWHDITLATLQGSLVSSAIGPTDRRMLENFWQRPRSEDEKYLCKNQKIKSTAHSNFSILGLAIVFILGILIIILDLTLESIIVLVEGRRGTLKHHRLEWFTNSVLQMQRLAHEELGLGTWKGCGGTSSVPVTRKGELLAVLDISDLEHPILKIAEEKDVESKLGVEASTQEIRTSLDSQQAKGSLSIHGASTAINAGERQVLGQLHIQAENTSLMACTEETEAIGSASANK
ncbi:MAG: hypothetical protein Q9227_008916 [Pyrenula ochraceoflavens]